MVAVKSCVSGFRVAHGVETIALGVEDLFLWPMLYGDEDRFLDQARIVTVRELCKGRRHTLTSACGL
jgi:hypothetical protein